MKTNHISRSLSLLVAALAAVMPVHADTYDAWLDGVYYQFIDESTARVVSAGTKYKGDVTVASSFEQEGVTYTVVEVADNAFRECPNLTSVTLPETITKIGVNAFFASAALTSVNLPDALVTIGANAFNACSALTGEVVLGAHLLSVGDNAFYGTAITKLTFARGALDDSGEDEVAYPDWVSDNHDDGTTAEQTITLTDVRAGDVLTFDSYVSSAGGDILYVYVDGSRQVYMDGENCNYVVYTFDQDGEHTLSISYVKNDSGTGGFDEAWVRNIRLLRNPVKYLVIGSNAFSNCRQLKSVDMQRRKIHAPNSDLIYYSESLAEVTVNTERIYTGWFQGKSMRDLTFGPQVHTIPNGAFSGCTNLRNLNINDAIAYIGAQAFYNCRALSTVKLPTALTHINAETFRGCTNLASIDVPSSVRAIGYNAFYDCYALKSFQVPEGVTVLNAGTFRYNHALNSISLPSTLTSIGQYALDNCENLTTLSLPASVESIDAEAFTNCGLSTFYVYNPTPITFGETNPFSTYFAKENTPLTLYVPAEALNAYQTKKIWQQFNDPDNGRHLLPIDVVPCAQPTFYYDNNYHLTIATATAEASIYYTMDGTDPVVPAFVSEELQEEEVVDPETGVKRRALVRRRAEGETEVTSTFLYEGVFLFDHNMTVKAVAAKEGMATSPLATFTKTDFKVATPVPTITVEPATDTEPQRFFMEIAVEQPELVRTPARIYYNVQENPTYYSWGWWPSEYANEEDVKAHCTLYEGKFELSRPDRMRIYAFRDDWNMADRRDFDFYGAYAQDAPGYSWDGENRQFTLSHASAEVWYTLDGSDPADVTNAARVRYTEPVAVDHNLTVRYVAIQEGRFNAAAQQTISGVTTSFINGGIAYRRVDNDVENHVEVTAKDGGYGEDLAIPETITQASVEYTVTRIGDNAFYDNDRLTAVTLPATLTEIGYRAFYDCDYLETVDIPANVRSIGQEAFAYNDRQASITFHEGLESIGVQAFRNNPMESVVLPSTLKTIGSAAFYECRQMTSLTLNEGLETMGNEAFRRCSGLTELTIPSSVTRLEANVFDECTALKTVSLPNTLNYIGPWCFSSCHAMTEWVLPASVTELGEGAFAYSPSLRSVVLPEGLTSLPPRLFRNDTGLTSVFIPSTVTSLGDQMFLTCTSLQSVELPASVTSLGANLFQECSSMKSLFVQNTTPAAVQSNTFSAIRNTATLYVPAGSKDAYESADYWKAFATIVESNDGGICAQPSIAFSDVDFKLTITSLTEGAVIHYTTDGTDPTADSPIYDAEARLDFPRNMTVKAIAMKEGMATSTIATYTRTDFKVAAPVITIDEETLMVTLSVEKPADNVAEAEIYYLLSVNSNNWPTDYRWNDTEGFTNNGIRYTEPFLLERPGNIRVYAIREGWINADQSWMNLFESHYLAAPAISHDAETKIVTITKQNGDELNPQVTVYYTIDGTDPLTSETRVAYEEPFAITHNVIVKAVATMPGRCHSDINVYDRITNINSFFAENGIWYRHVDNTVANEVEVTPWQGEGAYSGEMTIPAKVTHEGVEYDVTGISANTFASTAITSVTIPNSVKTIGSSAFYDCDGLTHVTLPAGLTVIPEALFRYSNNLETVTIPTSVQTILRWAFNSCPSLKEIVIPEGVTVIPEGCFDDDFALASVTLPSSITTLESYAFNTCRSLQAISLPAALTYIGTFALSECSSLTSVYCAATTPPQLQNTNPNSSYFPFYAIGNNPALYVPEAAVDTYKETAGWSRFADNTFALTNVPAAQPTFELNGYDLTIKTTTKGATIYYTTDGSDPTTSETRATYSAKKLVPVLFNQTVRATAIAEGMGYSPVGTFTKSDLKVATPEVTVNPETMMVTITVAKPDERLADAEIYYLLSENTNGWPTDFGWNDTEAIQTLTRYTAPFRLEKPGMIRVYALRPNWINSDQLPQDLFTNYYLAAPTISHDASAKTVTIYKQNGDELNPQVTVYYTLDGSDPATSETRVAYAEPFAIGQNLVVNAVATMSGRCNSTVTTYGITDINSTFAEGGIWYRHVDNNVANVIEVTTWQGEGSYTGAITVPAKVTHEGVEYDVIRIGDYAFSDQAGVTAITLPASIASVGLNTFYNCDGLVSLTLPAGITEIPENMCYNCDNLERVVLPSSVRTLGNRSFFSCPKLKEMTIPSGVTTIPLECFDDDYALVSVTLPATITRIEEGAFNTCTSLQSITLPAGLEYLGIRAFSECTSLVNIYCAAVTPPALAQTNTNNRYYPFYAIGNNPALYVPEAAVDTYKETAGWSRFADNTLALTNVPAAQPTFELNGYDLTIKTTTKGATIYYTTDGSDPTTSETRATYNAKRLVPVLFNQTVRATAIAEGLSYSPVGTFTQSDLKVATPEVTVNLETMMVTITVAKPDERIADAEIYYALSENTSGYPGDIAWNNTEAIQGLTRYTAPFRLEKPGMIRVYALRTNWINSDQLPQDLYTEYVLGAPEFAWDATTRTMTFNHSTEGVSLYYAFDSETDLTTASNSRHTYSGPFTLTRNNTLYAIAMKAGKCNSVVAARELTDVNAPFQVDGLWYRMTDNSTAPEAYLVAPQGEGAAYTGAVTVPATVTVAASTDITGTRVNVKSLADGAFQNQTGLTALTIAAPVTALPNSLCAGATALTTVTWPESVITIGDYAFDGCTALTGDRVFGQNIMRIGAYAFRNTALTSITVDNVPPVEEEIPTQHLDNWTSPSTGNNSSSEQTYTFVAQDNVNLSFSYSVSSESGYDYLRIYLDGEQVVSVSGEQSGVFSRSISSGEHTLVARYSKDGGTVRGSDSGTISNIMIGAGLHGLLQLGEYAFNNIASLKSVTVQRENVSVPVNAFEGSNAMTEVTLNTRSVNSWFARRPSLLTVTLNPGVQELVDGAFQNCSALGTVFSLATTPPTLSENTFAGIAEGAMLYVPEGTEEAYAAADYWNAFTMQTLTGDAPCALPQFALNGFDLTISTATEGAAIHYTTDGTEPTASSSLYTEPLPILFNQTVKAIAVKDGMANSPVNAFEQIALKVEAPTSTIAETAESTFAVTLTAEKADERLSDAQLYYTTDGYVGGKAYYELTPDEVRQLCTPYEEAFTLTRPAEVRAIALRDGWTASDWQYFDYSGGYSLNAPAMYYDEGNHVITIDKNNGDNNAQVTIYYTNDNSDPSDPTNASRMVYTEPITVPRNLLYKAVAVMPGHFTSDVASTQVSNLNTTINIGGLFFALITNSLANEYELVQRDGQAQGQNGGYEGDIVIPASIPQEDGTVFTVTKVADNAFYNCDNLTSVTFPETMAVIGKRAFYSCDKLTSVTLPASVTTIDDEAFESCPALKEVNFNEGLVSMGYRSFWDDDQLTSISLPNTLTTIGEGSFDNCDNLREVAFGEGLTSIGKLAFWNTSLTDVELPEGLTFLGEQAFENCTKLQHIKLPSTLTKIAPYTFRSCTSLMYVELPAQLTEIGVEAFQNCSSLLDISLPSTLRTLGGSAFRDCSGLRSIVLPEGITFVSDAAFQNCSALANLTLPTTLTEIQAYAFNGCTSLTSLILPDNVKTIGYYAFTGCNSLSDIYALPVKAPALLAGDASQFAFSGLTEQATLHYRTNAAVNYGSADYWKMFQHAVTFDNLPAAQPYFAFSNYLLTIATTTPEAQIFYTVDGTDPVPFEVEPQEQPAEGEGGETEGGEAEDGSGENAGEGADGEENAGTTEVRRRWKIQSQGSTYYYEGPVAFIKNGTVKAVALAEGFDVSPVGEFTISNYKVTAPEIAISDDLRLTLTSQKPGELVDDAQIYYTFSAWNDNTYFSEMTEEQIREFCTLYDGTYQLHTPGSIFVIALRDGWNASDWVSREYGVNETWQKLATPTISVNQITITLSTTDDVDAIYYTIDGTTPTRESTRYTAPFQIPKRDDSSAYTEIKAFAVKVGKFDSDMAYQSYRQSDWTCATPTFSGAISGANTEYDRTTRTYVPVDSLVYISCGTEDVTIYYTLDGTEPTRESMEYTEPINVEHNMTIKAFAVKENFIDSNVGTQEITWVQLHEPSIRINGAYCVITQDKDASIYYCIVDGDTDNGLIYQLYTGPFQMPRKTTNIWAYATKENYNQSATTRQAYSPDADKVCKTVSITRIASTNQVNMVTNTEQLEGHPVVIYYTLDGTEPTTSSAVYTGPVTLTENGTVKAMASNQLYYDSDVTSFEVTWFKVARPTFADDGIFLAIATTTENATIYYTTDDSDPTNESTEYTEPINMRGLGDKKVKAIAMRHNWNNSDVQSFDYTIAAHSAGTPAFTPDMKLNTVSIVSALPQTVTNAPETVIYYTVDGSEPTVESAVYTGPIPVVENCTIKAFAANDKLFSSEVKSYEVTWFTVATPEFAYDEQTNVLTITCDTVNATIFYAFEDQPAKFVEYDGPVTLVNNRVVSAYATRSNFNNSGQGSFTPNNFTCDEVTFTYNGRYITMATNEGATIRYTLDNSTPTEDDAAYTTAVEIMDLCNVRAIAFKPYFNNSTMTSYKVTYLFDGENVDMSEAGHLEEVFAWRNGAAGVTELPVKGQVNEADIAFIKTMPDLQHLDMSQATVIGNTLPNEAFAGTKLLSYKSPKNLSGVGRNIFKDCHELAAIVWNVDATVPTGITEDITNPNLLLYVNANMYAPANYAGNLIAGSEAQSIILTDEKGSTGGNNFYCPQRFYAQSITYSHTYNQQTQENVTRGWETLSLPFDVSEIRHATRGAMAPFAAGKDKLEFKPFWLYELTETGFVRADEIKAYTPYIVSMPNNKRYADDYILQGGVSFTASQTWVEAQTSHDVTKGAVNFVPAFQYTDKAANIMAINLEDYTDEDGMFYLEGSTFLSDYRDVKPFEAYARTSTNAPAVLLIQEFLGTDATGINDVEMKMLLDFGARRGVYDLSGRKLADDESFFQKHPQMKGIYIINGEKRLIQ